MATLLRKGKTSWNIEIECTGTGWANKDIPCQSLWKADYTDLRTTVRDLMGSLTYHVYFICPRCNCNTDVDMKLIPQHIFTGIQNQKGPPTE